MTVGRRGRRWSARATSGRLGRLGGRLGRPGSLERPPQGISALVAFLLLMAVVGIAVADARRTIGPGSNETDYIAWLMPLGGLVGYIVARSSFSLFMAHAIGAAAGTIAILAALSAALVGSDVLSLPGIDEVGRRMSVLWDDLIALTLPATPGDGQRPWGFAMLVLSALCWATAQFGAMSLFRHGRATPAVGAAGILLFLDILVPSAYRGVDPVLLAIAFAGLALFLLVRLHLSQQQSSWARRSVTEGTDVARVFMGAGAVFVVAVVIGTTALTTFAVAERGTIPWQSLAQPFESVRQQLLRLLEGLGVSIPPERSSASLFSRHQEIPERWQLGEGTAFRAQTESGGDPYWFGAAFDTITRQGYDFTGAAPTRIDAGTLAHGELEIPEGRGVARRESIMTTITPEGDAHGTLLGPATATLVSTSVKGRVLQREAGGARVGVVLEPSSLVDASYDVTSSELTFGPSAGTLAAEDLRVSDRRYPRGLDVFLEVDDGLIGPETRAFIERIERRNRGPRENPYDIAVDVQDILRTYAYEPDMTGVCGDRPGAECLLAVQKGFCAHYASAMALVLRELNIPTRIVHGYLPGESQGGGSWVVPLQAAHAWVEVWFEGAGWIRFDPTPQLEQYGGAATEIPEGDEGSEGPAPSLDPLEPSPSPGAVEPSPSPAPIDDGGVDPTSADSGPDLPLLASLVGLGVLGALFVAGGVGLFLIRRLPRGDATLAYRGIVRLASRLGHGPAPSQTEFEYVHALGETLPSVGQELELVAKVHVEAVYGRRGASADMLASLREAYARVRTALLRLVVRR
jgi:Transglutaminase-like superfamily/Domain of unknown function (DUF4129)